MEYDDRILATLAHARTPWWVHPRSCSAAMDTKARSRSDGHRSRSRSRSPDHKRHRRNREPSLERDARRKAKKEARRHSKQSGAFGYTDDANPFGDPSLSKVFVWKKKHKAELDAGTPVSKIEKKVKRRQQELRDEIERIKQRKEEREIEKEQMEEMKMQIAREMERDANADWDRKEEEFLREQQRIVVARRIREQRQKPSDLLAQNLFVLELDGRKPTTPGHGQDVVDHDTFDLIDPIAVFRDLGQQELLELLKDVQDQIENGEHVEYWSALSVICEDALVASADSNLIDPVRSDLEKIFHEKSVQDLRNLKDKTTAKVAGLDADDSVAVDVDYWQSLLPLMDLAIAKAYLREFYNNLVQMRLQQLAQDEMQLAGCESHAVNSGLRSPVQFVDEELSRTAIAPADDMASLREQRASIVAEEFAKFSESRGRLVPHQKKLEVSAAAFDANNLMNTMTEDEQQFSDVVQLASDGTVPSWADKYRPRKPKFFNCVKAGYEWSKYNQTHYDRENPPPKVVQGYKFNIFYPDLLDPSVAPTFTKLKIPDDPDFCILRFSAGPPYEDIAFKIVNKPWESSQRHGFRSKFERGVLCLYFNFRRIRYRR